MKVCVSFRFCIVEMNPDWLIFIFFGNPQFTGAPREVYLNDYQQMVELNNLKDSHFPKLFDFFRQAKPEFYMPLMCLIYDLGINNSRIRSHLYNELKIWNTPKLLSEDTMDHINIFTQKLQKRFQPEFGM